MPHGQIGIPGEKGVLVVVAGRQRVGKTTVANALVQYLGGLGCRFEVWNADQQNRSHSLSSFFPDALTPPPGGLVDGRIWLEQRLREQVKRRSNAVLDPGGGWTSFASLVREIPLVTALDAEGIRVIALFCVGAERADLDYLEHYAEADLFMPASTMIVLNAGLVLSGQSAIGAFAPIREHPAFRSAVGRGAQMATLPALGCMAQVTDRAITFDQAADGFAKPGQEPLSFLDRHRVHRWWRIEMPEFFQKFPPDWLPAIASPAGPAS
jgi:hypothetical protein